MSIYTDNVIEAMRLFGQLPTMNPTQALAEAIATNPAYVAILSEDPAKITVIETEGEEIHVGDAIIGLTEVSGGIVEVWARLDTIKAIHAATGEFLRQYYDLGE